MGDEQTPRAAAGDERRARIWVEDNGRDDPPPPVAEQLLTDAAVIIVPAAEAHLWDDPPG